MKNLGSKKQMLSSCKSLHKDRDICERQLKGSLEFQCFDQINKHRQMKRCLNQKSLGVQFECRKEMSQESY